ncbi:MAG: hypothetical protein IT306_02750 [Chloroflexi bacterium]|nr:hypothetical protein [Chloroflexota bacterium]
MDEMFEEVLAICLDRLADGDTVEDCIADFPECPELQPLLALAAALTESAEQSASQQSGPTWLVQREPIQLRPTG